MKTVTLSATLISSTYATAFEKNALFPFTIFHIKPITVVFSLLPDYKSERSHTLRLKTLSGEGIKVFGMNSTYEDLAIPYSNFDIVENLLRLNSPRCIAPNHQLPWGYCINREKCKGNISH